MTLRKFVSKIKEWAAIAYLLPLAVAGALVLLSVGQIAQVLWSVISLLFWGSLTVWGIAKGRVNAALVIGGLALYGASWPIAHEFGQPQAFATFAVALLLWGIGVFHDEPRRLVCRN